MSVQLFVAEGSLIAGNLKLLGDEHHYLSHVRRLTTGDRVVLMDGQGLRAHAQIESVEADATFVLVETPEEVPKPSFSLEIAIALIKGERMDQAITKMVELGVTTIRPIVTERTIVRLKGSRVEQRQKRFASMAKAASRQSRNPHPATIAPIESLQSFLNKQHSAALKLIPALSSETQPLANELAKQDLPVSSALVLIGPEGGFTESEVSSASAAGYAPVSLGGRILRAETACLTMASILSYTYGDVGS